MNAQPMPAQPDAPRLLALLRTMLRIRAARRALSNWLRGLFSGR